MNFLLLMDFIRQQNDEMKEQHKQITEKLEQQNKQITDELKQHNEEQIGQLRVELQEHNKKWKEKISELQKKTERGMEGICAVLRSRPPSAWKTDARGCNETILIFVTPR